jgi:hypothetical protein
MDWLKTFLEKIQLQSVLIILIILYFGVQLLKLNNSIITPAGILGAILIVAGGVAGVSAVAVTQTRESYSDVIAQYKHVISTLKSSNKYTQETLKDTISTTEQRKVGNYTILGDGKKGEGTQDS